MVYDASLYPGEGCMCSTLRALGRCKTGENMSYQFVGHKFGFYIRHISAHRYFPITPTQPLSCSAPTGSLFDLLERMRPRVQR